MESMFVRKKVKGEVDTLYERLGGVRFNSKIIQTDEVSPYLI